MKHASLPALLLLAAICHAQQPPGNAKLPFVYTRWKQFTKADGLPNEHIFAVKSDGPRIWVGTEGGLAVIDKKTGKVKSWTEKDGLPWRVVSGIDINHKTGEVWLALFGGGLARFSGGRFDHWTQMNSGLVNDVAYGVAVENDNVWVATTAGASRLNTVSGEWTVFTEKNAPMEEIWNYGVHYGDGKVHLAVWGSGVLEFDVATSRWKDYLDPDGEMEIDLYRDDGIVHVITTGADYVDKVLWVSTYFGVCRYDGRNWRGFYNQDSGLPSDFNNNLRARSGNEAWFATDKGAGAVMDAASNTWVAYTRDPRSSAGKAVVTRDKAVIETVEMGLNLPHNYVVSMDVDGNDVFVGTSKGLAWGIGDGYYAGLKERPRQLSRVGGGAR
ncbi:MAG: regulator [Candidatus Solibacter usitatus]|nr:regulator [Candidatus Solibacter usitatus]